jgi:tetratricopeptide (TPR) repeat protein
VAAIRDDTSALEADPKFVDAYVNRAQVRQSQKDIDLAIADYSKAIELKPDAGVYYARATVRQAKQDLNGAFADYSKAVSLDPKLAEAYAGRAVMETLQGKKAEAIQDFEKAFELEPSLRQTFKEFFEKRLTAKP